MAAGPNQHGVELSEANDNFNRAGYRPRTITERGPEETEHHSVYCPNCGFRLYSMRCKLVCAGCGYYLSCADYY